MKSTTEMRRHAELATREHWRDGILLIPCATICVCSFCDKACTGVYRVAGKTSCQTCYYTVICECGRWGKSQEHICLWSMLRAFPIAAIAAIAAITCDHPITRSLPAGGVA